MSLNTLLKRREPDLETEGGTIAAAATDAARAEREEAAGPGALHRNESLRLRPKEALHVLIQLRSMLVAGVPLLAALRTLIQHAGSPRAEKVLRHITALVESGHDLSYAIGSLPRCFESYTVHLLAAGERSGALDDAMERCIELMDKQIKLSGKIKGALAYPGFLLLVTAIMTTCILVFLVPKFEKLLSKKPELLPTTTKWVLATSEFLRSSPETAAAAAVAFVLLLIFGVRYKRFRAWLFEGVSRTPLVGTLIHKAYISRSVNALAMTLESGVPILTGLEHARQISQLPKLQQVWTRAGQVVRDGRPLHVALEGADLPPALVQMIVAGESSGSLDASLRKAGEFLDRETEAAMNLVTGLLGPMTVVIAGAIVGFIVVSLMMPILQMAKFVG